jgi:hypothetical protein
MSEGKRPGGLTALAVINFVLAGMSLIGVLGLAALFAYIGVIPTDKMDAGAKAQFEALQETGIGFFVFLFILSIVVGLLLLLAGIGYLKQKKILGWGLGNAYGIIGIISSITSGFLFPAILGGGFGIGRIIDLLYPIITLILLNTTFKEDFPN